jgi:hypothetical protein
MNTSDLKAYAPKARKDFIAAVTRKAELLGLNPAHPGTVEQQGDVLLINGQAYPARIANQRVRLATRIAQQGFAVVMEALAYTWFNRLVAIRYMELHGYLDHGYRVLSHPDGGTQPEILEHLARIELPGLDRQQALEWKAAGNRDEDLYRAVLLAQCHALHTAMPFLFEAIDDATELLLPDGLLRTDSLIRNLVTAIEEASWQEVEIIGWLYQFYISEKKADVIGKVVKSEDIPAATQLFTPNWIVKYMVQNSLGAQWLATYPESGLKTQMAYYIEPAEQTDEVKAQLAAITPASLEPEALTLIDPACGSGHILVEAYELFKAIYLERGYVLRDIPKLILEKNLYGLDIDERAAQLTGFALMMKARADDRRLFERSVQLNVMALQNSTGFDAERLAQGVKLADYGLKAGDLTALKALFEHATTFGSLIQVPEALVAKLPTLRTLSEIDGRDLFTGEALTQLKGLVSQAQMLASRHDAVVANPPYMGGRGGMNPSLKKFVATDFPNAKSDLFACFIERGFTLAKDIGHNAMVTMESWLFLPSYECFRASVLRNHTLRTLAHFPYDGKRPTVMGINFGIAAISAQKHQVAGYRGHYCCSRYHELNDSGVPFEFPTRNERLKILPSDAFAKIPGSPVAYWISIAAVEAFNQKKIAEIANTRLGMATASNHIFLRLWQEVCRSNVALNCSSRDAAKESKCRWFPYQKGGDFRKWYGNLEYLVDWQDDGLRIQNFKDDETGKIRSHNYNLDYIFRDGVTWCALSSSLTSARFSEYALFDNAGSSLFADDPSLHPAIMALLNSKVIILLINAISTTLNYQPGDIGKLPANLSFDGVHQVTANASILGVSARKDWNSYELSWDFRCFPLVAEVKPTLEASYIAWTKQNVSSIAEVQRLEVENNRLFIDAYELQDELTPEVPIEQITLTVNPAYRYGGKLTADEQWTRFREDTMQELVSYAIGCMMGRYSLDAPGLIYAHSGNEGFDHSRYTRFPADADGIVPVTDIEWFDDDACTRLVEFISVVWDKAQLEQNLQFLADNLSPKRGDASRDTIRRYLCDRFFKDHLQTYKKRPIYWLFTSGKEQAFQCLVYLHRYNAGTLSRMRMEYVVPLQSRMQARIDKLADDLASASSSAQSKQLQKLKDSTQKKLEELRRFDEKLRHYADQRITLDLDDGVKVNYGKFGDLLAEVKAVAGDEADS